MNKMVDILCMLKELKINVQESVFDASDTCSIF